MKAFLVGGAVRDYLLDWPVKEKDWVVVGETPESMLAKGFKPVGKDFPVFLHPLTHDEYALARTERKTAPGYKGFVVHAAPEVTLEEDLIRRDLTINAMAMCDDGTIIDPYNGRRDLEQRIFRHISPAFGEDPVRILRVARFAARYAHLGFTLAEETRDLMEQMVGNGETEHLVAERVWAELYRALLEQSPSAFFNILKDCRALESIFPEIARLFGIPQPPTYHPEIDTGIHVMMVLDQAAKLSNKAEVRLAALLHDLGKGLTPPEQWPSHHGHEKNGLPVLEAFCERLRVPKHFKSLCQQVMRYHGHCHRARELRANTLTDVLNALNAFKPKHSLAEFLLACEADMRGRKGFECKPYPQADYMAGAALAARSVDTAEIAQSGLKGSQIGAEIRRRRIAAVSHFIAQQKAKSE